MSSPTANQWGAAAALSQEARPYYDEVYRTFGERREYFFEAISSLGLPQNPAPGAFTNMMDIRPTGLTSLEAAELFLREGRTFIWPAPVFGEQGEGWLRMSLVQPLDTLKEAVDRLAPVIRKLVD